MVCLQGEYNDCCQDLQFWVPKLVQEDKTCRMFVKNDFRNHLELMVQHMAASLKAVVTISDSEVVSCV